MVYDVLLLLAVLFIAAAVIVIPLGGAPQTTIGIGLFRFYLIAVAFVFFGWFWTHGGQTLGMRAWRLRVVRRTTGNALDWHHAAYRFGTAILSWLCFGLGFLWMLVDRERLTWHDRLSDSLLVLVPKPTRRRDAPA